MKRDVWCAAIVFTLSSCSSLPTNEEKLVGTWVNVAAVEHHKDGSKARFEIAPGDPVTFTRDQREVWPNADGPPVVARWHLEGDDFVFTIISKPKDMKLPPRPQRERLVRVTDTELVFSDGKVDGVFRRVR